MDFKLEQLKLDSNGLVPAIVQDVNTREVLTLAYMNAESLKRTVETKETWFWSRSRNELWHKGEMSGNTQRVVEIRLDCDQDALIVLVEPAGPACHMGEQTCFHNRIGESLESGVVSRRGGEQSSSPQSVVGKSASGRQSDGLEQSRLDVTNPGDVLDQLYEVIESRKRERPAGSYTTYLFNEGLDKILKKIGEESAETIVAAKNDNSERLIAETSDLIYHLLVLLVERGISLDQVRDELRNRRGQTTKR
jgi:phosphoribosyl-AMP cyclohydrolase / phosphoribosyl-ATP pyrophosphohydrolase